MALTKKQLGHLEKRLLDERERALKALGLFDKMTKADRESGDSDLAAYTDHMADQGTEAMEREKAAIFATKEGRYLYRLEEALRRLYNDPKKFGMCHTCGSDVGFDDDTQSVVRVSRSSDPFRGARQRVSPLLVFHPSEFARLRLQYNWDHEHFLDQDDEHSVWAGIEFMLGSHPAHSY